MENLKLPITVIGVVVLQIGGFIWWTAQQAATIADLEETVSSLSSRMAIEETVNMNGTNQSIATTASFAQVHRAFVASGDTNVGKIQIKNASNVVVGEVAIGYGQTLMSVYTVPAGHTAYLSNLRVSSSKQTSSIIRLMVRPFGGVFRVQSTISLYSGSGETQFVTPLKITEKSNIDVRITGGTNNTVSCDFDMILVQNPA